MPDSPQTLLEKAAARLGVSPLAKRLRVPDGVLAAWISGHAPIPESKLGAVAELLAKLGDDEEQQR